MNHIKRIQEALGDFSLEAILISSEVGGFYALGMRNEGLILLTPTQVHISVDGRYIEAVNAQIEREKIQNVTCHLIGGEVSHIGLAKEFIQKNNLKEVAIEEGYLTLSTFRSYEEKLPCKLVNGGALLTALRSVKTEEELGFLRTAQEITDKAFTEILNFITPQRTEKDISARLAYEMAKLGGLSPSFSIIVATGANGSRPHAVPGDRTIDKGQFLTMDFGCLYKGYCSDMTRTICMGKPTEKMELVYNTVLEAQKAALAVAKAGMTGKEVDSVARSVIEKAGFGEKFSHGLGHGVGVEIHEEPNTNARNEKPLPVNAVCSIEPGIYLAGEFGVRIEDVIVLKEGGCEILTASPKELILL
ncbi:MAG: aminopeptidase P family protein [Eubacteriales bacterium]